MTKKDFELLMKELQLTGVVHKRGPCWYIRHQSQPNDPVDLIRFRLRGEVRIVPTFGSHGSRIKKLRLDGSPGQVSWLRQESGMWRERNTKSYATYQKPLSTNQVIEILKKIARGELEAP